MHNYIVHCDGSICNMHKVTNGSMVNSFTHSDFLQNNWILNKYEICQAMRKRGIYSNHDKCSITCASTLCTNPWRANKQKYLSTNFLQMSSIFYRHTLRGLPKRNIQYRILWSNDGSDNNKWTNGKFTNKFYEHIENISLH